MTALAVFWGGVTILTFSWAVFGDQRRTLAFLLTVALLALGLVATTTLF